MAALRFAQSTTRPACALRSICDAKVFALTVIAALSLLGAATAEPLDRELLRSIEKEGVQLAQKIEADSTQTIDSLREKDSAAEIQAGMDKAFAEWKEQTRRFMELPARTPFRDKVSASLQAEWDRAVEEVASAVKVKQTAIKEAFGGLVADNGERFDRPIAARRQLVNQGCSSLEVAFDNATKRLAGKRIDFLRQISDAAEREAKAEQDSKLAAQKAAEDAKKAAEEAALQKRIAEQNSRQEEIRLRNSMPAWGRGIDLDDFVKRSGLKFPAFVRFGTAAIAKKAEGDRFDRMEAEEEAKAHSQKLSAMTFLWTAGSFKCLDEDVPSDDPKVVKQILLVDLPFRVDDLQASLGPNVSVWDSVGSNSLWFLTKDQKLAPIDSGSALVAVRQNNGIVYLPDSATSQMRICVAGTLEDIKDLARNKKNYVVQFQVVELGTKKTLHWGYYQEAAARDFGWHAPAMRLSQVKKDAAGGGDAGDPPVYFRTKSFPDTPELIVGSIKRIEVARVDGEARKVLFTIEAKEGGGR